MDRLTLSRRPETSEKEKCLPAGDALPSWSTLPLYAKFPMVPNPKGSMVFCSTNLCETKHKSSRNYEFDLSDPYCHVFSNEYHPLHDRHLRSHFNQPQMRRHLLKNDFLTEDGKVICTLKEFNRYRQYLRRICLMEMAFEKKKEKENSINDQKETAGDVEEKPTDIRIRQVREKLEMQRALTRQRIEQLLQEKTARLQKRLENMQQASIKRDLKRQEEEQKRQIAIIQHHERVRKRNRRLIRRWKAREQQHTKRLEEKKKQRIFEQQKKSYEAWQTRKQVQKERMERETEILRRENERRERNISVRERLIADHRNRIEAKLDEMKERTRRQKKEREERLAQRLTKKLALAEIRAWARHNGKRRRHMKAGFRSIWNLGETMKRLIFAYEDGIAGQGRPASVGFLQMLNKVVDDDEREAYGQPCGVQDEDFILREHARFIVDSVINKVRTELHPEHLLSLDQDSVGEMRDTLGHRKSVKFGTERIISTVPRPSVDVEALRPVREHVLTPVASFEMATPSLDVDDEELGDGDGDFDQKIVEKILHRLLDDLNEKKLSKEDLVKLTSYSLQILTSQDQTSSKEDVSEFESGNLYETAVASDLVDFTMSRIVDDVKSGLVDQDELTDLALSVWDVGGKQLTTVDEAVDNFIDETIQHIVSDKSFDRESSVHDFMLDEFIVKTLNDVSNDLKSGYLPMGVISQILEQMSEVIGEVPSENQSEEMLRRLLERVTQDVLSECSDTLYRVVNIIITSYHMYRESSTQLMSELISDTCTRLSTYLSSGQIQDSEINFEALCSIAMKISPASMSSADIYQLASNIAATLHIQTDPLNVEVDHVIRMAITTLKNASLDILVQVAFTVTTTCQSLVDRDKEVKPETTTDAVFFEDATQFVVDILKLVSKSLDRGSFSDADIQEMTHLLQNVSRGNSLGATPEPDKKVLLGHTLASILDDVENGRVTKEEMYELGNHLKDCGERLLGALPSVSLESTSRTQSFTSTAVADNVVSHVLSSIQSDIDNDLMRKDSLKELAVCILKTRMSAEKQASDECLVKAVDSTHTHPSPCESRLAEELVFATIDAIVKDLDEGKIYPGKMSSIASSAISSVAIEFAEREESSRFDVTMNKILACLREDTIDSEEAKRMFVKILDLYRSNWSLMLQGRDISALSSNSRLAECLIRETLNKIERDIRSGAFSDDELQSLMGSGYQDDKSKVADDIVNLVSAIIQEILQCLNSGSIDVASLSGFLDLFVPLQHQPTDDVLTPDTVRQRCKEAALDIRKHGGHSVYIKNVVKSVASSKGESDTGPLCILQSLLKVVDSNILTNFIRVTLQTVLCNIGQRHSKEQKPSSFCVRSDVHLQSVTSLIAQNVVRNLMARIDRALVMDGTLPSDEEILPTRLDSQDFEFMQNLYEREPDGLTSYSSKEIGSLILDTLNNVVSNLRLERSMPIDENNIRNVSSDMLHDFVLGKLQYIVESMQDLLSAGAPYQSGTLENYAREDFPRGVSILSMNNKEATSFVGRTLQDVVRDLAQEVSGVKIQSNMDENVDKQTSTLTLEVENIVVSTLQDIVDEYTEAELQTTEKIQQEIIKRKALDALSQMRRDVVGDHDHYVKDVVTRIIMSEVSPLDHESEATFMENVYDSIVNNIEIGKIKASDLYQSAVSGESGSDIVVKVGNVSSTELFSSSHPENFEGVPESRTLQTMTEIANKILKFHDEEVRMISTGVLHAEDSSIPCGSLAKRRSTMTNVAAVLQYSFDKTIDNVKEGSLSDEEIMDLATALSQSMLDGGAEQVLSNASPDSSIEDFIVAMLEEKKREIEERGLDSKSLLNATERILDIQRKESASKREPQDDESVSSVSSEMLASFVQDILQKIASSISQLDTSASFSINVNGAAGLEKSGSAETQSSGSGSITKKNINPNAAAPLINKIDSNSSIKPTKGESFPAVTNPTGAHIKTSDIATPTFIMLPNKPLTPPENVPARSKCTKAGSKQKTCPDSSKPSYSGKRLTNTSVTKEKQLTQTTASPIIKKNSKTSYSSSPQTPQSKVPRHLSQTKSSSAKSVPKQTNKATSQVLPVICPSSNKTGKKTQSPNATGENQECWKAQHVSSLAQTPASVKVEYRGTLPLKKQAKDCQTEICSTQSHSSPLHYKSEDKACKLSRRNKTPEDKRTFVQPNMDIFTCEDLIPLNISRCKPDTKSIPMEVHSICGSHKTKIRVIRNDS